MIEHIPLHSATLQQRKSSLHLLHYQLNANTTLAYMYSYDEILITSKKLRILIFFTLCTKIPSKVMYQMSRLTHLLLARFETQPSMNRMRIFFSPL